MKKVITLIIALCVSMSLLACGGKTSGNTDTKQTQEQAGMSWQEQYDLGIRLLNEGKYEDAILAFQAAIQIDPKNVEAYVALADVHMQMGNQKKAESVIQQGCDNCGESSWDMFLTYAAQFELSVEIDAANGDAGLQPGMDCDDYIDQGEERISQGKYQDAVQAFENAITLDNDEVEAYLGLADAYYKMGDTAKAAETLQRALEYCDSKYDIEDIQEYAISIGYMIDGEGKIVPFDADVYLADFTLEEKIKFYLGRGNNASHWCFEGGVILDGKDSRTISMDDAVALSAKLGWGEMTYDESDGYSDRAKTKHTRTYVPFALVERFYQNAGDRNHFETLRIGEWYDPVIAGSYVYVKEAFDTKPATGVYDIHIGDSLTRVLEQLGWEYAEELADLIAQAPGNPDAQGAWLLNIYNSTFVKEDVEAGQKSGEEFNITSVISYDIPIVTLECKIYMEDDNSFEDVEIRFNFDSRDGYSLHSMVISQHYR